MKAKNLDLYKLIKKSLKILDDMWWEQKEKELEEFGKLTKLLFNERKLKWNI